MSELNIATYPRPVFDTYRSNLGRAALDLLGALLASRFEILEADQEAAEKAVVAEVRRIDAPNLGKLYRLAGNSDSVSARVVAELNAIASRD